MVNEKELIEKLKKVAEALRKTTDPAARKRTQQMLKASFLSIRNQLSPRTCGIMDKVVEKLIEESLEPTPVPPAEELPWDKVKEFLFEPGANAEDVKKAILQCADQLHTDKRYDMNNALISWLFYEGKIDSPITALNNYLSIYENALRHPEHSITSIECPLCFMFYKYLALGYNDGTKLINSFFYKNKEKIHLRGDFEVEHAADRLRWDLYKDPIKVEEFNQIKIKYAQGKEDALGFIGIMCKDFIDKDPLIKEALHERMDFLFKQYIQERIQQLNQLGS
ncbi:hypothetical protein KY340_04865 [Candidatus Woesearchaeota archaeon]|nr:hypothetical protein [Candidatus Woesearchaeota archaeon]